MAGCRLGQVTSHFAHTSAVTQATLAGWLSKRLPSRQYYNYIPYRCNLFSAKVFLNLSWLCLALLQRWMCGPAGWALHFFNTVNCRLTRVISPVEPADFQIIIPRQQRSILIHANIEHRLHLAKKLTIRGPVQQCRDNGPNSTSSHSTEWKTAVVSHTGIHWEGLNKISDSTTTISGDRTLMLFIQLQL